MQQRVRSQVRSTAPNRTAHMTNPILRQALSAVQLTQKSGTLKPTRMQHSVTFLPPTKPFRHLGVALTVDLNYKPQLQTTLNDLREKVKHLKGSHLTTGQKQRVIESSLRGSIAYAMVAAPYTMGEIKLLDSLLTQATKRAYKLPVHMTTAAAHMGRDMGGLGCHSLEDYTICSIKRLTQSLRDQGSLGTITRAMLDMQLQGIDTLTAKFCGICLNIYHTS